MAANSRLLFNSAFRFLSRNKQTYKLCSQAIPNVQDEENTENSRKEDLTFDGLLRNSKFFSSGSKTPVDKKVVAKIIAERGDDLYVDFGGKFHAVVTRPKKNGHLYVKDRWVNVMVRDLEVTEHFLGDSKDTSLLEAHVDLVDMASREPR